MVSVEVVAEVAAEGEEVVILVVVGVHLILVQTTRMAVVVVHSA